MMRDAYLAIGREYGATRRRSMPLADFAGFGPGALDVGAGSRGATGISRARAPPRGALRPRQEAHAPPPPATPWSAKPPCCLSETAPFTWSISSPSYITCRHPLPPGPRRGQTRSQAGSRHRLATRQRTRGSPRRVRGALGHPDNALLLPVQRPRDASTCPNKTPLLRHYTQSKTTEPLCRTLTRPRRSRHRKCPSLSSSDNPKILPN